MRYRSLLSMAVIMSVLAAGSLPIGAEQKTSVTAKVKSIAAFKNGLGFFVREGEANLSDGWATYDGIPPAALGTFWVGSGKPGVGIERLVASEEEVSKTVPAVSIGEMLSANVGRQVTLTVGEKISGKLIAVPEDRKPTSDQPIPRGYYPPPLPQSSIVLVETNAGVVAVNKNEIRCVEFGAGDKPVSADAILKEKVKRLRFKMTGAKDKAPVTIAYLQKGISWSPAYLVELLDDNKARITMQGLLVNDVEDIDGVNVSFVVGYPNFIMSDTLSPLSLTQSLSDFVASLDHFSVGRAYGSGGYGGMAQQSFSYDYTSPASGPAPSNGFGYSAAKETPGAPEEDLFLYQMKGVSLKKGERAYYTVFSAETPYKHVYQWDIPDTSNVQPNGYVDNSQRSDRNENVPVGEQVWHKIRLTNTSKYPWTTAPAMAMSNGQPLSQDSISYTPKGADGDLKITVATDLKGSRTEVEKSRGSIVIATRNFIDITADGKLTLKSFKTKPVTVTINKTLTGEATSAGQGGKITKKMEGLRAVNPTSVISWDVVLKPGEEKTVDYTYHTYIQPY
jgi:hypothetical protein